MRPGDWFQLDLGASQTFNQIVLDSTASAGDFARQYEVSTSDDGTTWSEPIATGPGSNVTRILLPRTTARHMRIVNKGSAGSWWSIHELSVLAPNGTAATSTGTGDGLQRKSATLPDGTQLDAAHNSGSGTATFDVAWGDTTYSYRLPVAAAVIFSKRPA